MRTLFSALLAGFLFISCNKDKPAEYFIKFKVGDEYIKFTKAGFSYGPTGDPDIYYVSIAGRSENKKDIFIVGVNLPSDPQPGTYDSENDLLEIGYGINAGANDGDTEYYTMYPVTGRPNPHFILTITSRTETEIRGSFTGNYLADEEENFIEVTEGEFVAKLTE